MFFRKKKYRIYPVCSVSQTPNNNTDLEGAFKDVDSWKICDRDESEIYKERKSFMNSKTLYKE